MSSTESKKYTGNSFEEEPVEEFEEPELEEEIYTNLSEESEGDVSDKNVDSLEDDIEASPVNRIRVEVSIDNHSTAQTVSEEEEEQEEEQEEEEEEEEGHSNEEFNVELEISSTAPSDFNSEDHALHLDFVQQSMTSIPDAEKRFKNGTRKSLSFSNERMREIERHNRILLQKILSKGPGTCNRQNPNPFAKKPTPGNRMASATVNRKNQQRQIELDNLVLKRKIEAIASRRPKNSI